MTTATSNSAILSTINSVAVSTINSVAVSVNSVSDYSSNGVTVNTDTTTGYWQFVMILFFYYACMYVKRLVRPSIMYSKSYISD